MRRICIFIGAGVFILAAGLFFSNPLLERTLYIGDVPHKADAIIVLSGDADPSYLRTKKAIELFKQGYADYIIFTGYGTAGDSGEFLSKVASHYGIPKKVILIEPYARSTYENFFFSKPLILKHGFQSILIVTSPYHQLRSYLVAKTVFKGTGIEIYNCASHKPGTSQEGMSFRMKDARFIMMEYFKLIGYYMLGRI